MVLWQRLKRIFKARKPAWASGCELVYTDLSGMRYYKYIDDLDLSVERKGEIDKCLLELQHGSDLQEVMDAMTTAMNHHDKEGNMKPDIVEIGYYIQELQDRKRLLLLPDILFEISATTIIREDEIPYTVDQSITKEKVNTFRQEIQRGGLHSFFQCAGILKLLGLSGISTVDLMQLMTESEHRARPIKRIRYTSVTE